MKARDIGELKALAKKFEGRYEFGPWQRSFYSPFPWDTGRHKDKAHVEIDRARERRVIRGRGRVGDGACNVVFGIEGIPSDELMDYLASVSPAMILELIDLVEYLSGKLHENDQVRIEGPYLVQIFYDGVQVGRGTSFGLPAHIPASAPPSRRRCVVRNVKITKAGLHQLAETQGEERRPVTLVFPKQKATYYGIVVRTDGVTDEFEGTFDLKEIEVDIDLRARENTGS